MIVRALYLFVFVVGVTHGTQHKCFACFGTCVRDASLNVTNCDCSDKTICHGSYCFSKLDIWPEENLMTIQKGCRDETPGGQEGCQYLGSDTSIACYCTGDHCNTYAVTPLPLIDCCECDYKKHACRSGDCSHKCQGNYCLMDFEHSRQSCGFGYPQLWTFMRSQHFARYEEDQATCLSYTNGHKRPVHGCTCTTKGGCNKMSLMKTADNIRNDSTKDTAKTHFCYNLAASDDDHPLNASVFKQSTQCKGQFCYITLQSAEVGLDYDQNQYYYDDLVDEGSPPSDYGQNGPKADDYQMEYGGTQYKASQSVHHSIEAGCMSVGDVQYGKVQLGCYTERQSDTSLPLVKHCVCASHMCNYYYAVAEEDEQFLPPRREVVHTTSTHTTVPPRRTTLVTQTPVTVRTTPSTTTTTTTKSTTRTTVKSTTRRPTVTTTLQPTTTITPSTSRWKPDLVTRQPLFRPAVPGKSSGHSIKPVEIDLPDMGNTPGTYSDNHFGRVTASVVPASVFYSTTRPWQMATAPPRRPTPPARVDSYDRDILPGRHWPTKELPTRPPPPAYRFPTIINCAPRLEHLLTILTLIIFILR